MKNIILMKSSLLLIVILVIHSKCQQDLSGSIASIPRYHDTPCNDTNDIVSYFAPGLSDGYTIQINRRLTKGTQIRLKFDMEAMITEEKSLTRLVTLGNNVFKLVLLNDTDTLEFVVKGHFFLLPPYLLSVKIKGEENCKEPDFGYFQRHPVGAEPRPDVPNLQCGRRKGPNQLITNGFLSKPGDWPWHVALFRIERATLKYICGGTLISNIYVLTAAHCVTINNAAVLPESLGISLGKHNLIGGNVNSQERGVYEVIAHEDFLPKTLDNDIALLKMSSAVEFNSNIQAACIWFDKLQEKLPSQTVHGTVTGWGFDQTESLSTVLQEATMPMIGDLECIRSKPLFFATILNGKKFCAGHRNGTSACNGDSGGGFSVYVPYEDSNFIKGYVKGAWYVRGIVSLSVAKLDTALCDPTEYVVFTDIGAYTDWINDHMD
ncbi:chymotrypsin-C-like isoform X3 [Nymphalis io]|uniref:chymotrypsin-C-like isoform X1 n=1 Tax=Inachis io TaxID=171585 RepID=UPI00216A6C62|nr:chymotrypsin-C-like isoform X1 [Nymphalis io]XP_050356547.1 chymotrypsin-C-like isoform X3 [Nymphalis io]